MPDNWADMIALAAKIKDKGSDVAGIAYNIHDWPDDWLFRSMILQGGGQMLDASETAAGFGNEVGLKALRYCRQFVADAKMPLIDWDSIAPAIHRRKNRHLRRHAGATAPGHRPDRRQVHATHLHLPDRRQSQGWAADRRQCGDHHGQGCGEAARRVGVPQIRQRPGSAEDRGRDNRLYADELACGGTRVPRLVL